MTADDREASLRDSILDLVIYAPIGLALDAEELAPDLARRGRNHAAAARRIGEFAVLAGRRRIEQALAQLAEAPSTPTAAPRSDASSTAAAGDDPVSGDGPIGTDGGEADETDTNGVPPDSPDGASPGAGGDLGAGGEVAPAADGLAIPEYDLLAASQVVKRLDALTPDQLEDVRRYEEATRGRRTILHKIARLQA